MANARHYKEYVQPISSGNSQLVNALAMLEEDINNLPGYQDVAEATTIGSADNSTATLAEATTFPRNTTIAITSTGGTTLSVASTTNFASTGKLFFREVTYTYTGKTSTTFTGLSPTLPGSATAVGEVVLGVITVTDGSEFLTTRSGFTLPNGSVANFWTRSGNELRGVSGGTGTHAIGAVLTQPHQGLRKIGAPWTGWMIGPNNLAFVVPGWDTDNDHKKDFFDFFLNEAGRLWTRNLHLRENGDPPELNFQRSGGDYNLPDGPPSGIKIGQNVGITRWYGSVVRSDTGEYLGFRNGSANMYVRMAEDGIYDVGTGRSHVGGHLVFGTTPVGTEDTVDRWIIRADERNQSLAAIEIGSAVDDGRHYLQMFEQSSAPANPAANGVRIFARDDGSGKTQVCAIFNTGAVQVMATQP